MKRDYAEYLLNKTNEDYNLIADHFASTRMFPSKDLKELGNYAQPGDKILDLGCGSGRLFAVLKDKQVEYVGVDNCEKLIKISQKDYPGTRFITTDGLNLPFSADSFDKIYCIAVLHHIPSSELRLAFLKEARRVLKPTGILILRVWDLWRRAAGKRLLVKFTLLKIMGRSQLDLKDVLLSWRNPTGKIITSRYFHAFTLKEIKGLIREAGLKEKKGWRGGDVLRPNIYLIAEK